MNPPALAPKAETVRGLAVKRLNNRGPCAAPVEVGVGVPASASQRRLKPGLQPNRLAAVDQESDGVTATALYRP